MAAFPAVDELDSQPALSARHQGVPGSVYSNDQMAAINENLRRATAMDFSANQPLASVNPFGFDASMAALDPAFSANMQMQMTGASQGIVPDMSMHAQYQAAMGYAQLSAPSAAFQSTMGMSQMNPFLSNSPSMPLSLDTDLGGGMGDVFAANQFGTPILTSPMVANFGPPMFGSSGMPMSADPASQFLSGNLPSDPSGIPSRELQHTEHQSHGRTGEPPVPAKVEKVNPNFPAPPG
jgi:hypothetical protein